MSLFPPFAMPLQPPFSPSLLSYLLNPLLISSPLQCHSWSSPTSNSAAYLSIQVPQSSMIPVTSQPSWESWVSAADRWRRKSCLGEGKGWGGGRFREVTESEVEGEEALPGNAEVVREWGEGKKWNAMKCRKEGKDNRNLRSRKINNVQGKWKRLAFGWAE